jgi:pimeloyl-ACP methyl ester carboxylesterase
MNQQHIKRLVAGVLLSVSACSSSKTTTASSTSAAVAAVTTTSAPTTTVAPATTTSAATTTSTSVATTTTSAAPKAAAPAPSTCPEGAPASLTCVTVAVPIDPKAAGGGATNLAVTLRRAKLRAWASPVVILAGPTPSQNWASTTFTTDSFPGHDVVVIDVRGAGRSESSSDCANLGDYTAELNTANLQPNGVTAMKACFAKFATAPVSLTSDLDHSIVAADIATVRRSLGIDKWSIYTSTGAADIAIHLVATDADAIAAVVARDPNAVGAAQTPNTIAETFDRLATDCAAAPTCAKNGDLKALLVDLVARPPVTTTTLEKATGWPIVLDSVSAQLGLTGAMRNDGLAGLVPGILSGPHSAEADANTSSLFDAPGSFPINVAFIATFCQDLGYNTPALKGGADDHAGPFKGVGWKRLCDLITPVPQMVAPPKVTSKIPVFTVLSSYENRSSESITKAVFAGFANLTVVTEPGVPNATTTNPACYIKTTSAFIDAPTAKVDTTCLTKPEKVTFS